MSSHRYHTDEAIFYLLEPDIESELEDLDDSDEELEPNVAPPRIKRSLQKLQRKRLKMILIAMIRVVCQK